MKQRSIPARLLSFLMVLSVMLGMFPLFATPASAAVQTDIPQNMWDNAALRSLEYLGYNLDQQKADGTLYVLWGNDTIKYMPSPYPFYPMEDGIGINGDNLQWVGKGNYGSGYKYTSKTGYAPWVEGFQKEGLVCAGYIAYYVFGYLPHIEGVNISRFENNYKNIYDYNVQSVVYWYKTLELASNANNTDYSKVQKLYGAPFDDLDAAPTEAQMSTFRPGDIVLTGGIWEEGTPKAGEKRYSHAAIYAGYYNGRHWMIEASDACPTGPHIYPFDHFMDPTQWKSTSHVIGVYRLNFVPKEVYQEGSIQVYKTDPNGKALAGAQFLVTNTATGDHYTLGPTDANGYAKTQDMLPFGTYTVKETVFPTGYKAGDITEWTVIINETMPQTITINAINKPNYGKLNIVKQTNTGMNLSGWQIGVYTDAACTKPLAGSPYTTGADGTVLISNLEPGTYYAKEVAINDSYWVCDSSVKKVTVEADKTSSVTFSNTHYGITDDDLGVGTPSQRYANNVAAIKLLKQLEAESRLATPEEQEVLSQYVGWGGLSHWFDDRHPRYQELKDLLTAEEYAATRESSLTAFYTPPVVIRAMYKALESMNFRQLIEYQTEDFPESFIAAEQTKLNNLYDEFSKGGLFFGLNAISKNLILCNPENLLNQAMIVLGIPGSGKSFLVKLIIIILLLTRKNDDILICDPDGEYGHLVKALTDDATVISLDPSGKDRLNPMYMVEGYGEDSPIADKSQFILSLIEQIDKSGVGSQHKSIIDRCVASVYEDSKKTGITPTLSTLREKLLEQPEPQAKDIALSLELYTTGTLNIFGQESNVDLEKRALVFDIHRLSSSMKAPGLLVITDTMINRVALNWKRGKRTHVFVDEYHVVFQNEHSAAFFTSAWRQFRKRNAYPTAITQNVEFLLNSVEASTMLSNSELIVMLNQKARDRQKLGELLNISDEQMGYVSGSEAGSGLIKYGSSLVPFVNRFPKNTKLYQLMTTTPGEGIFAKGQAN